MEQSENPVALFLEARARAAAAGEAYEATAGVLATAAPDGAPSARFVLVKEVGSDGFYVYTNYGSRKAGELDRNPRAALCFHWAAIGEQYRIEGSVARAASGRSDAYFASRPRESQLGAWASEQSTEIESRDALLARFREMEARFAGGPVPRPPHWGGFRLDPERIERWVSGDHRLHDRVLYVREGASWSARRLAP